MQKLHHQPAESLERSRNSNVGVNLDENTTGCVDVDLEQPSFVKGRVEKSEKALEKIVSIDRTKASVYSPGG